MNMDMRFDYPRIIPGAVFALALLLTACGGGVTTAANPAAPVTTAAPAVTGITDKGATFSVTINKDGTGYYLVQPAATPAPTVADVQRGTAFAMSANVAATETISGLTPGTAYTIYFVAADAANNVQMTVQSVTVTAAAFVEQGGLIWMPVTFADTWTNANDYCNNTTINGLTGWRMPTSDELNALYQSGMMNGKGWTLGKTWSSAPSQAGGYYVAKGLNDGSITAYPDRISNYVSCVRTIPTTVVQNEEGLGTGRHHLIWMPVTFTGTWMQANAYCNNTTINGLTGWRMPTFNELLVLQLSGMMNGKGWELDYTWSSDESTSLSDPETIHEIYNLGGGENYHRDRDTSIRYVSCVRTATVQQGGLSWMPIVSGTSWSNTNTDCAHTSINGLTGWRMPTAPELGWLYQSGAVRNLNWMLYLTWSSTVNTGGYHLSFNLDDGSTTYQYEDSTGGILVSCVRPTTVIQGGLDWMPVTVQKNWTDANAYCASTAINGLSGWRMPTDAELSALYQSGAMNDQGWSLDYAWSSTSDGVNLSNGKVLTFPYTYSNNVSCVRTHPATVQQGGLLWTPVNAKDTWTNAYNYCTNTTINGLSGWRMPTRGELSVLQTSGEMNNKGWALDYTWSSSSDGDVGASPTHDAVDLADDYADGYGVIWDYDISSHYVSCVRTIPATLVQGGLTWMPVTSLDSWSHANAYCTDPAINGLTGWRMPTYEELSALQASGMAKGLGWALGMTWSSTYKSEGRHDAVNLNTVDFGGDSNDTFDYYVSCVR